jgi:WD40 repeat protein
VLPTSEVAFSKDGAQLAAYDYYGPVSIWNLKTRKLVRTITVPDQNPEYAENKILNVTFKPSGKVFITVGHERWDGFYVWDEDTDKVLVDGQG